MSRQIGVGLIGAGWMGSLHAQSYRRIPDHYPELDLAPRLVIAADADPVRAEAARRLGFEQASTDPTAVIEHPEVEAVSIATTNDMHLALVRAAAERGKHVWVEKPVGRFPAETIEVAEIVASAQVMSTVGFNYRFAPLVRHTHELVASGALGDIRNYRGRFFVDYASHRSRAFSWRFSREVAGLGVLGDIMSHVVDQAHQIVGPIAAVCAHQEIQIPSRPVTVGASQFSIVETDEGEAREVENDDYAVALVEFESGARGTFEVSRTMVGRHCDLGFEVHGSEGAASWSFQRMNELELYLPTRDGEDVGYRTVFAGPQHGDFGRFEPDTAIGMGYSQLKVSEARSFVASVVDGCQRPPGMREAERAARVTAAMIDSAATGAWREVAAGAT